MIQIQNLTASYGSNTVIRHFCLEIPTPSLLAIIGNNGSGKTTFLKALANLIPFEGEIIFPSNHKIAYLGQQRNLQFDLLVKDIVVMGRFNATQLQHNYTQTDYDLAFKALQSFGLEHTFEKPMNALSGGMQQLVWFAQIAVREANIIILDEPLQNLDLYNKNVLMQILHKWVHAENKTVIFSTHDIDLLNEHQSMLLNFSSNSKTIQASSTELIESHKNILLHRI